MKKTDSKQLTPIDSTAVDSAARVRKMWAYYLVYPCVYFYAMATRLPLIFLLYADNGLNLSAEMGVLAGAVYSLGRAIGATLLSKKDTPIRSLVISSGSSVAAFAAILLIPAFPNTTCDDMGFNCFEKEENHFQFLTILVRAIVRAM